MTTTLRGLLIALLFAQAALAQVEQPISLGEWRVQAGDDPRWAKRDFDDSAWRRGPFPNAGEGAGPVWFRSRVRLPDAWSGQNLALGMGPVNGAYRIYLDGIAVAQFGDEFSRGLLFMPRHLAFPLTAASRDPVICIRFEPVRAIIRGSLLGSSAKPHPPLLGLAGVVMPGEELDRLEVRLSALWVNLLWFFVLACGIACLWRYRQSPGAPELLWIGLALTCNGGQRAIVLPVELGWIRVDLLSGFILAWGPFYCVHFFYVWFAAELVPPARRVLRLVAWPIAVGNMMSNLDAFFPLPWSPETIRLMRDLSSWAAVSVGVAVIVYNARRGSRALVALGVAQTVRALAYAVTLFGFGMAVANSLVSATIVAILFQRSSRRAAAHREAERDLEAASRVQTSLLGAEAPRHPKFAIESAYAPARQVGGDFYYFSSSSTDESLLVVAGDVSGKGLQAALLVASVIGSLRNEDSREPALVLARLNQTLVGHTGHGFVTCCCLRLEADGTGQAANAGHPAPWLNGKELDLTAGLPLGVVDRIEYEQRGFTLPPGGCLTVVSDGVVEAENSQRELFGFERTREISMKPAQEIAEAAKAWGQTDDITVVTVRRKA